MALTKKDIENLSNLFATKKDLEELKLDFQGLRNDFLTGQDKFMKKLEDMYIEMKMFNSAFSRQEEKTENHEKRIKTLEEKVLVS